MLIKYKKKILGIKYFNRNEFSGNFFEKKPLCKPYPFTCTKCLNNVLRL